MKIHQLFSVITDRNMDLQERLYRLLVSSGTASMIVVFLVGLIAGGDKRNLVVLACGFVFFGVVYYLSRRFHKIKLCSVIVGIGLVFFVLPAYFLTGGGIYGGAAFYFLFGILYTCIVVEGKPKYILLVGGFIMDCVCYYIAYRFPELVNKPSLETIYFSSAVALLIIAAWSACLILFQNAIFRSENELAKEQNREIEELNRAQNHFFSSMSHEIRTPINTIIGLNEMILREDISEEVAVNANNIQNASKMLLALINDFLDMSKIESGKMNISLAPYDVGATLSDIVNIIWVRAKEKGLEFHIDVDQSVPAKLIGDEVRIKQILTNVLNNAVKYTQNGSITLSIQSQGTVDGYAQISYSVTDTGMGIKKESIPHLFSAFKRVEEENIRHIEGTGLGLAIVKQLVDLMGGDIAVNSVYTKGSTFVITLPQKIVDDKKIGNLDLEAKHAPRSRNHYKQSFEAPKAHVLVVDDNETNLMVVEKLLRDTKMQVDTSTNGMDCLEKTCQERYDVILMDHLMPVMDGIECMHNIRTQTGGFNQETPVVILTANAGAEYRELYQRERFDGYLLKPVGSKQLEAELLRHLPKEIVTLTEQENFVGVVETPILSHKRKRPVMISTESVCDLPKHIAEKNRIAVIPYRVFTDSGEFLEGIEAGADGILTYIGERGKQARAEAPTVAEYEEFFAEQLTQTQYIVHITMAKYLSHGYRNALEASKAFDNVIVVDSGHVSGTMGLMVMRAAKCAANGMNAEAIVDEVQNMKPLARTSFYIDSLEYLSRTEKLDPKIDAICKALMLHPVLTLKKSNMKVGSVWMGIRERAMEHYIFSQLKSPATIDKSVLFITYSGLTKEELNHIQEQVKKKVEFQNVICQKASSATSTHCGPGSFGLLFLRNK